MGALDYQIFIRLAFAVIFCILAAIYLFLRFRHRLGLSPKEERCPKCRTRIPRGAIECPNCGISVLKERYWCRTCVMWVLADRELTPNQPFAYAIKGEDQAGNLTLVCPMCMTSLLNPENQIIMQPESSPLTNMPSDRLSGTEGKLISLCFVGGVFCVSCIGLMFVFHGLPQLRPYIDVLVGIVTFCLLFSFLLFGATAFYIERKRKHIRNKQS